MGEGWQTVQHDPSQETALIEPTLCNTEYGMQERDPSFKHGRDRNHWGKGWGGGWVGGNVVCLSKETVCEHIYKKLLNDKINFAALS